MRIGVNQSTVSRLYSCWTKMFEAFINEFPLWPDKTSIQESVPAAFKNRYPDTCVIIYAEEIEIDRSRQPIPCSISITSVELSRGASFIHSLVRCSQLACEGEHFFLTTLIPPLVPPTDSEDSLRDAYAGVTVVNKMAHFTLTDETNKKCGSYHQ